MTKTKNRLQAGFTLVEMLATMVIIGVLSLAIANFIANWLQASSLAQTRSNLLTNAETALDTITDDIRLSGSADQNNRWADTYAPGNQYGWTSDSQTLVLAKATINTSNNVIFSDPANYISQKDDVVYFVSSGTLYRRIVAAPDAGNAAKTTCPAANATSSCPADKKVATGVTSFAVTYYDADNQSVSPDDARSVQLAITLSAKQNTKTITASYTTRMVFRNE